MKVLKWFRYGFLSLGFLYFLSAMIISSILPFDYYHSKINSAFFIIYAILSIIELCCEKSKFNPLILFNFGIIMTCKVFWGSDVYQLLHRLLSGKQLSQATVESTLEKLQWVYYILTGLLLILGVVWGSIKAYKKTHNNKLNTISKMFMLYGMVFFLLFVSTLDFGVSEPVSYLNSLQSVYKIIGFMMPVYFVGMLSMFITGISLKLIYVIESKEGSKKNDKQ